MHPFFHGFLSFLLPGIILLGTFFITHGSMDGLFGVLALAPLLGIVWFLLACVAGAVYLLTRD